VDLFLGDPTKAKTQLGWKPEFDIQGLVEDMMKGDIELMLKSKKTIYDYNFWLLINLKKTANINYRLR